MSTFHISMFHSIYRHRNVLSSFDAINGSTNENIAIFVFFVYNILSYDLLCHVKCVDVLTHTKNDLRQLLNNNKKLF